MNDEKNNAPTESSKNLHVHVNSAVPARSRGSMLETIVAFKTLITSMIGLAIVIIVVIVVMNVTQNNRDTTAGEQLGLRQVIITDTIVTGFRDAANLIIMEVDMEHRVEIAERGGLFWLGTREQIFIFHGTGVFTTDLSAFSGDNVIIDSYRNRVWVAVQRPVFYGISMDWDGTVIDGVTTSFFGWGVINLTPGDFNEMMRHAGQEMELQARQELTEQSYTYTEAAIHNLITNVLAAGGITGYEVRITWQ